VYSAKLYRFSFFARCGLVVLLLSACSTQKNKFLNKKWHNTTTRYNVYFNGNESLKEGVAKIESSQKEDYTKLLPVFVFGDENSSKSVYPEMDRAIKKGSKGIQRHSMLIKGTEYNKWIDDSYLVIGQAHFYKQDYYPAIETFDYVAKAYKEGQSKYNAMLWLSKTYLQMKKPDKASKWLDKMTNDKDFPEELKPEYHKVYADYYIRQTNYKLAIPELKSAISLTKKKKKRTRMMFILAQLYQMEGNAKTSSNYYELVLKQHPPYEMAFYAKINRALAYDASSGMNSQQIKKQLLQMAKDAKNKEYLDQIYFALGEIEQKEAHEQLAIDYYLLSTEKSISNNNQKGRSFLKLADIYFDKRNYELAEAYYDSTVNFLDQKHSDFDLVMNKKNSLTRLVTDIRIIEKEDSLQRLTQLSQKEIEKLIENLIQKEVDRENEEKAKAEAQQQSGFAGGTQNNAFNNPASGGGWYFINPQALSFGFSEFKKIWGDRKLEDNWRRKNKSVVSFDDNITGENIAAGQSPKDTMLKSDDDIRKSHQKKINAYYDLGIVYKEQLKDNKEAIEAFENIPQQYDTSALMPSTCYHLYRLFLEEKNQPKADYYKNLILNRFPDTEYAKIIRNPNYFKELEADKKKVAVYYEETYKMYKEDFHSTVISRCAGSDSIFPGNAYKAKFALLKTLSVGKTQGRDAFETGLKNIVSDYSGTEEAKKANELLALLSGNKPQEQKPAEQQKYTFSAKSKHSFVAIVPEKEMDINIAQSLISDFNKKYFSLVELTISNVLFDNNTHMISVKQFDSSEKAMEYYQSFKANKEMLKGITEKKVPYFVISYENFAAFYNSKNIEEYLEFFNSTYQSKP
jgi:tetratricopeptide (TPR) repeat protein